MNDEFLHALRRDPPARFARQLKQKLQGAQPKRRFWRLRIRTLLLLLAGPVLAAGIFVLTRQSSENPQAVQAASQDTSDAPVAPVYRPGPNTVALVPEGGRDAHSFDDPQQADAVPAGDALSVRPEDAPENAAPVASSTPSQTSGGGLLRSRPPVKIATSSLTEDLVRSVLAGLQTRPSFTAPRVEKMEAAAAIAALCTPEQANQFDIAIASRRITHAEFVTCRRNGVVNIVESKLGYLALVLTSARDSTPVKLSTGDVYLALAKQIPDPLDPTRFIANPNVSWDQVNARLEYRPIAVFGPMRDTPLRTLFDTLVLAPGCYAQRALEPLRIADPARHAELCRSVRGDRLYSEVEQTSSLIPQYLWADLNAFVLVDYDFYRENRSQLADSALEGPEPSPATFANGSYPLARPVYFYADLTRIGRAADAYDVLRNLQTMRLSSPNRSGFVRLDEAEAKEQRSRGLRPLSESDVITLKE